ncbi:MAG: RsmE family RNA methyltransferase, partial [Pseudomonadota bacterium]
TSILPVQTEFAQVSLSDERSTRRRDHWRGVAIAAAQQSGRTRVPSIHDVQTLASALAVSSTEDEGLRLVADTQSHGAWPVCDASRVTIAIGPEGGFSDTERAALDAHGFAAIGLGPRVLRTETAAITALTLIQCRYGDLP